MIISAELLDAVNACQLGEMEKIGTGLDPNDAESCATFSTHVKQVEAAIVHTYQLTAASSLREADPAVAAQHWKKMNEFCEQALVTLTKFLDQYPKCGTPELYNLTIDYKIESERRYYRNIQDSECSKTPPPEGLFPTKK